MSRLFGPIRQTAYVVPDIEEAMRYWSATLGVGPFFCLRSHRAAGATYRGAPTEMCISLAFAQSGGIQIELVQQHDDAPSLFRDFRAAGLEGAQHVAFWTRDFDADLARYVADGYRVVQTAGLNGAGNRNAFLERPGASVRDMAIEVSEISGSKGLLFERIAAAAVEWDGQDPVRPLG